MSETFSVYQYERNTVALVVSEITGLSVSEVQRKTHFLFVMERLETEGVEAVVVERGYVDRDYLSDYPHFHARSFHAYERFCTRLHFFRSLQGEDRFRSVITGVGAGPEAVTGLQDFYLGFMVVRPLPGKFVGRTCLKLGLASDWTTPLLQTYDAGLFGIKLTVPDTLAFQEQDSVVAACATCSVWFALNATGERLIPSPGTITRHATPNDPQGHRVFPNRGLDMQMIVRALKREHFEVVVRDFRPIPGETDDFLRGQEVREAKRLIYAYLRGRVATPIMGLHLCETKEGGAVTESFARHAITVVGYQLGKVPTSPPDKTPAMRADAIEAFLVHDDKVGPFCEMKVIEQVLDVCIDGQSTKLAATMAHPLKGFGEQVSVDGHDPEHIVQVPSLIALATYHKIRVQLKDVAHFVHQLSPYFFDRPEGLDTIQRILFGEDAKTEDFIWDIYVGDSTSVKAEIRDTLKASGRFAKDQAQLRQEVLRVVTAGYPRYVWRATAYAPNSEIPLFDLVIDATDSIQPRSLLLPVFYSDDVANLFSTQFARRDGEIEPWRNDGRVFTLIDGLARHFQPPPSIQVANADEKFGHSAPPRYIKEWEKTGHQVLNQQQLPWTRDRCFVISETAFRDGQIFAKDNGIQAQRFAEFIKDVTAKGGKCIWLIDHHCNLVVGEDALSDPNDPSSPTLGHPTLIGGGRARMSGELRPPANGDDCWVLSNASGRYSKLRTDRGPDKLNKASDLVRERCKAFFNVRSEWTDRHGPNPIQDGKDAGTQIEDIVDKYDTRECMSLVEDWAEDISQKRDTPDAKLMEEIVVLLPSAKVQHQLLLLHLLDRLWNYWPAAIPDAAILQPYVEGLFQRIAEMQGVQERAAAGTVAARLAIALHEEGLDMGQFLEQASDWLDFLPLAILLEVRKARTAR